MVVDLTGWGSGCVKFIGAQKQYIGSRTISRSLQKCGFGPGLDLDSSKNFGIRVWRGYWICLDTAGYRLDGAILKQYMPSTARFSPYKLVD